MLTALYDGNCLICQSTCTTVRAFDWLKRIDFVNLHEDEAWRGQQHDLKRDQLMGEIHVLDQEGRLYAGFQGTRRLLKELPLGFPFWLLLQLPGMDGVGRRVYRYIARRRYRINALFGNELPDCGAGKCKMLQ